MKQKIMHCRRCGACCRIKDGIVRVSEAEVARIAAFLGMSEDDFIANETEVAPDRRSLVLKSHPDGACVYLTSENLCRINPVKPDKCRTFPSEWTNPDSAEVCPELSTVSVGNDAEVHVKNRQSDTCFRTGMSRTKIVRFAVWGIVCRILYHIYTTHAAQIMV